MNAIPDLGEVTTVVNTPVVQAIAWALMQFVWQGALIGVLAAATLAALRRSAADVRYVVATIALSLMLTIPVVTAVQRFSPEREGPALGASRTSQPVAANALKASSKSEREPSAAASAQARAAGAEGGAPALRKTSGPASAEQKTPWASRLNPLAAWLLVGWTLGVLVLTLRLFAGWLWIRRLKTRGAVPARESLRHSASRLAKQLHVSRVVRLVESSLVEVPTVIGWLKPVILLPASALAGLSPVQLEAILAHELAHIRRHDYLVNLLQTLVETLLFYHPAVWWVSRQIRIERENCCDDLAVALCGDPVVYAQALANLEHLRGASAGLAMAASGGSLLHRVRRLLAAPSHAGRGPGWLAGAVSVTIIVTVVGLAAGAMSRDSVDQAATAVELRLKADAAKVHEAAAKAREGAQQLREGAHQFRDSLQRLRDAANQIRLGLHEARLAAHRQFRQIPPPPPLPPLPPEPLTPLAPPVPPEPPVPPTLPEPALLPDEPLPPLDAPFPISPMPPAAPMPPAGPTPLMPPTPPMPLAAPMPPEAPVSPAPPQERRWTRSDQSGNFTWSNDGEKLEVNYRGAIEFTDDDSDVKSLTPGGSLRIRWNANRKDDHTVEFRANASGAIERRFWAGGSERPFEPEGRKWLATVLPRFIRQTGIGAPARVERIYKAKGAQGVLAEIALVEGSWAKRVYFAELLKTPGLDSRTIQQVLAQAGRDVDSDFELASLLISSDRLLTSDDATRKAFIEAAQSIDSDFEMRRVFSSALKADPLSSPALNALLQGSLSIQSDFEQASLLMDVAKQQLLDDSSRDAFFKALGTVDSDFEHRRVLSTLMKRSDLPPAAVAEVIESAGTLGSDFEAASLLLDIANSRPIEGALRAPFFRAVGSISSTFERGRVLSAVAKRADASAETVLEVIRATKGMGHFEAAQVLLIVAGTHPLTREARDAYIDAAEKLGDFEQGRVLAALVKNERRK